MMVIGYFDWFGTPEQLEELVSAWKKGYDNTPGVKFLGKFACINRQVHWAIFLEVKDYSTLQDVIKARMIAEKSINFKRDLKTMPHFEEEFFY